MLAQRDWLNDWSRSATTLLRFVAGTGKRLEHYLHTRLPDGSLTSFPFLTLPYSPLSFYFTPFPLNLTFLPFLLGKNYSKFFSFLSSAKNMPSPIFILTQKNSSFRLQILYSCHRSTNGVH